MRDIDDIPNPSEREATAEEWEEFCSRNDWAWEQLIRVERYLEERTDLAYLRYARSDESAELYSAWQTQGDALWIVRDARNGRFPLVGTRTRTTLEAIVQRVEEESQ